MKVRCLVYLNNTLSERLNVYHLTSQGFDVVYSCFCPKYALHLCFTNHWMQIQIRILYLLFLLYFPSTIFAFYSLAIENDGDCPIAIFSISNTDEVFECIIEANKSCSLDLESEVKLIAIDPYSIEQPRYKTELLLASPQPPLWSLYSCLLYTSPSPRDRG